ncbi:hypothetical protein OG21DRAFT_1578916 [Imleria badia]|nr:hypothetical protein OG21DRAFT_1578916 [Imleria badia]
MYMVAAHYRYASPASLSVTLTQAFEELRGMLNYAKPDMMTTDSSSPFGQDDLVAILDPINSFKDDEKISDQYSIWVIGMTLPRYATKCQPRARLNADTPLFRQQSGNRRTLFKAINLCLFGSPNEHAVRLQCIWVRYHHPASSEGFINRLMMELGWYTIVVAYRISIAHGSQLNFLAVVTTGAVAGPIEIIIYCLVVSTVASIMFSFGLSNVYSNLGLLVMRNAMFTLVYDHHDDSWKPCGRSVKRNWEWRVSPYERGDLEPMRDGRTTMGMMGIPLRTRTHLPDIEQA